MINILIVDDHPIFRAGLIALLDSQHDMTIVGEASNGREAVEQARVLRPSLTLLDLQMPEMNGVDAIHMIRAHQPGARIIVMTTFGGDVVARQALNAGAQAYLLKGMIRSDLVDTIRAVQRGSRRISADVATELANHIGDDVLSEREKQVLELVARGNSNKRIATMLSLSVETVKGHVKSIFGKLGARDRTHAVTIGLDRGIFDLSCRHS
jgi:DNA-binding NarL/FixJ family response regulator